MSELNVLPGDTHPRVVKSLQALMSAPRRARVRRPCAGHLTERHAIEPGDQYVMSALPPNSELGNLEWWRHALCMRCCPAECVPVADRAVVG